MKHIMLDLETWGTRPVCAIASIGAVAFDPVAGTIGESFYATVSLKSCLDLRMFVEAGTVEWWMQQSDAARKEATRGEFSIVNAIDQLSSFWWAQKAEFIWSHGANFDEPVIQAAFRVVGKMKAPWQYWGVRDTRTIFDLAGINLKDFTEGTAHNAVDDARSQAKAVNAAYRKLCLTRVEPAPRPTVAELEAILASEEPLKVIVNGDGSVSAVPDNSPTPG